ncbi:MAG: hypothetical protein JEZ06_18980 [Anaerolineaceae bacterium]|nr:hypothetical protein [Anaerolineaceae bacterium]
MIPETNPIYLADSYQTSCNATILDIQTNDKGEILLILDGTVLYPEGGGQPSDIGEIVGQRGSANIHQARHINGIIFHKTNNQTNLKSGDSVTCNLDWENRLLNMRCHTGGHILHDALSSIMKDVTPVRGNHGKKAFVEYQEDSIKPEIRDTLEAKCNQIIEAKIDTFSKYVSLEELKSICPYVPNNLPEDKPLRVFQIEGFPPVPCGGTQVKNTAEVGRIEITSIAPKRGLTRIRYQILD